MIGINGVFCTARITATANPRSSAAAAVSSAAENHRGTRWASSTRIRSGGGVKWVIRSNARDAASSAESSKEPTPMAGERRRSSRGARFGGSPLEDLP